MDGDRLMNHEEKSKAQKLGKFRGELNKKCRKRISVSDKLKISLHICNLN